MRRRNFRLLPARLARAARAAILAAAALTAGCSPTYDWREVALGESLLVLLPCRPDRAAKNVALGTQQVTLEMAGCAAGGATFAVAQLPGGTAAQAALRQRAWRAALEAPWHGAQRTEASWPMPQAAAEPPPWALTLSRVGPGDGPREVQIRGFAHADAQGRVVLYQATVLGRPSSTEASQTFFDSLRWR